MPSKEFDYIDVYREACRIAEKEAITGLRAEDFVVQRDTAYRMMDDESDNDAYATLYYRRPVHDMALAFHLEMYRHAYVLQIHGIQLAIRYDRSQSAQASARLLYDLCCGLLNGQVRLALSIRSTVLASELMYVSGRQTIPLVLSVPEPSRLKARYKRPVTVIVLKNSVAIDQVELESTAPVFDKRLMTAYEAAGRTVDWSDPQPLEYADWKAISRNGYDKARYFRTMAAIGTRQLLLGMLFWQTWACCLFAALLVSAFFPAQLSGLVFTISLVAALIAFTWHGLPWLINRRDGFFDQD